MSSNMKGTLEKIIENTTNLKKEYVKRVIIIYDHKITNIGDCCLRFGKLKYLKAFFNNAEVDINFRDESNRKYADSLLKNNLYLSRIFFLEWNDIDFLSYDVIAGFFSPEIW
jgi:hypothetical protein